MTRVIVLLLAAIAVLGTQTGLAAQEQQADPLDRIAWIVGTWRGLGEGQPGNSASERYASRNHDNRFIRVEGRSVYPRQERNPEGEIHTSTDVWSYDRARQRLIMRQFDSLGFVTTYVEDPSESTGNRLVLVAELLENVPTGWRARYTYEYLATDEYRELFELDSGRGFERYVAGRFLRLSDGPAGSQGRE